MHAVVVRVTITEPEGAVEELKEQVVPAASAAPGFVAGYWTRKEDKGLSMIVFESEETANGTAERIREMAPSSVTVEDVEVREVVASA